MGILDLSRYDLAVIKDVLHEKIEELDNFDDGLNADELRRVLDKLQS